MNERPTILAVDDDPVVTEYLQAKLGASFRIITTNVPAKALELAHAEQPDLILVDVDMEGVDGFEVCRRLKANGVAETPVVFLTGRTDSADEVRGFEAGGVDYIHKHLEREVLEARVRQQLTLHRVQAALRERLRQAVHNLRTTKVTTGVYWVQVPEAGLSILCGSPEDVVKHLMLRGYIQEESRPGAPCETGPNVILLSDLMLQNGRFANMAEFPVLQMLYRQGMILPDHPNNTGRKPILVGSPEQVAAQLAYIYRGNYGLASHEELRAAGLTDAEAERHIALKLGFAFGKIRPSEDLLDSRIVGREPVEIANGVTVRRIALNKFELGYQGRTTQVDLNLQPSECYEAPYTLGQHRIEPQYFGIVHSGEGDGWDVRRQCMGSVVMYQGRYYLVDAGPGIADTLKSLGIDVGEIEGIFHTHAHDDHFAGLPALLASGRRLKYFTTPLVRHSVMRKLSALLSIDQALFDELFDVRDLAPELWNDCDGMEVMPLPTPHPVENCLFMIRVRDDETYRTYAHWADIVSFDVLRGMLAHPPASEVLGADYLEKVRGWYLTPATVKKIDSGGGLIHGEPLDFAEDTSDKIILAHRASGFSPEQLEIGSNAVFGAVEVLIPSSQDYLRQRAAGHLARHFPDATPAELNGLLRSTIVDFNAGSIILRRHTETRHVYLLLAGSVEQIVPALGSSLAVATGSLIGAHALTGTGRAGNTWRAVSPVRAMRISVGTLRAFLRHGGQQERWRTLWEATAFLRGTALFGERIGLVEQERVARAMRSDSVARGAPLARVPGALCVVREGELRVKYAGGHEETVAAGGFIGEESVLGAGEGNWMAKARSESTVEWIPAEALRRIPIVMWKLLESQDRRRCAISLFAK
jgi:DNA-binding response OmpR family regulator/CRP-like cAMP-binding protein